MAKHYREVNKETRSDVVEVQRIVEEAVWKLMKTSLTHHSVDFLPA